VRLGGHELATALLLWCGAHEPPPPAPGKDDLHLEARARAAAAPEANSPWLTRCVQRVCCRLCHSLVVILRRTLRSVHTCPRTARAET